LKAILNESSYLFGGASPTTSTGFFTEASAGRAAFNSALISGLNYATET